MSKSTNFTGQPIFGQLLKLIDFTRVNHISAKHGADRYVKKLTTRKHLIIFLYAVLNNCGSLREVILGLLADAHKLAHLGLDYMPKRSTLSDANERRPSDVFGDIYMYIYRKYAAILPDSQSEKEEIRRLYIMDSTTITLFKEILKGAGRKPLNGKKKGGIKAHTLINYQENVPCLVRYSAAARHDHQFLKTVQLPEGSYITFDKAYVDYKQYEQFTCSKVYYVTRLKKNAKFKLTDRYGIYKDERNTILEDADIELEFKDGAGEKKTHKSRRIIYKEPLSGQIYEFITNQFDLEASSITAIYKKRWQIETLFKQIKQNFPLKYFLGDNTNAIESQIWVAMLANLLITIVSRQIKRKWAFSNLVGVIRQQLMNYINIFKFLENPEAAWIAVNKANAIENQYTLFSSTRGA